MLIKLFTLYVYLQTTLCGCAADRRNSGFIRLREDYKVNVQRIGHLEKHITESSGLAHASDTTFWTHPDGGSINELYLINLQGELLKKAPLEVKNLDWEDLAEDEQGNLYIGDFGNNANVRQDLQVYKVDQQTLAVRDTIRFHFADQTEFPPPLKRKHYDLEAFFYSNDSLYLFTKSRALKSITRLYRLLGAGGNYLIQPQQELRVQSAITAADISPAQDQFALLGYGRLYLFQPQDKNVSFNGKRYCLPISRSGQAEAVLYLSENELLISNENGKLYLVTFNRKPNR